MSESSAAGGDHDPQTIGARARASHRQTVVVVGALAASLFFYAIVVEVLNRTATPGGDEAPELLRWLFYTVAVTMVFTSHVVKNVMLRGSRTRSVDEILARLTTAHVVVAAMAEVPAVLGLVLFVLGRRFYPDFYILAVISVYLMARHFPRYGSWEDALREHVARS